ncbi:Uma2 family endonuclease (plasmid) [Kovacikia minuta CCNUW1]|uniref:Uma2 family endonuclease n=1 Tax=Kovacikia minuta TaxID=2931930 RepID=UPI001CCE937A|nr:Uma2 family endonuclease [Kovacikia minuta]UBF30501.1 Uma2 family endonuclease [Kovacikia minuta CCNUW1]
MTTLLIKTKLNPITVQLSDSQQMTKEQFYHFCQINRDLHIERTASGEVIIMSPAFSDTGNRNFNLAVQLGIWAEQDGSGIGFDSSAGFTLPNGATRSPDVSWVKLERWNALSLEEQNSFAPLCPDFVVELRSASDSLQSLQEKMQEYIANGALLGWLIDRKNCKVHIYRPDVPVEILENPDLISGDPLLPGFALEMGKVW